MPAPSLLELARKECIKNIQNINHVGTLEYEIVRPLLLKLTNPEQLRDIEQYSPQICGYDEKLWLGFIKRDAPGWEMKSLTPESNRHWYQTYQKAVAQSKAEVANDERILKATMDQLEKHRLGHTSKQVQASTVPRLPKLGGMRATPREPKAVSRSEPKTQTVLRAGTRTKTLTGRGVMEKARKEAQERKMLQNRLTIPTHKLNEAASRVQHVSYSLMVDHVKPAKPVPIDPTVKPAEVFAPKRKRVSSKESAESDPSTTNDREQAAKKLKTATTGSASIDAAPKSNVIYTPPQAPANTVPRFEPSSQTGQIVRPSMKARRPVNIFMPAKRR